MDSHVIRTQTIVVNSVFHKSEDRPSHWTLNIPEGLIITDDPSQMLRITLTDFSMPILWYWVNETNNKFTIEYAMPNPDDPLLEVSIEYDFVIPPGNYTFKQLAATINGIINPQLNNAICSWNPSSNRLTFTFLDLQLYTIKFDVPNSAYAILGFDKTTYYQLGGSLQAPYALKTALFERVCLTIDNVTIASDFQNLENSSSDTAVTSKFLMSIPFNLPPFDTLTYTNTNGMMALYIKEKTLNQLVFSIRDSLGREIEYVTNWKATIKIDVLDMHSSSNSSQYSAMINLLQQIEEKLSLIFVQRSLV